KTEVFGYPVSRTFLLLGCPTQVFQRQIATHCQDEPVRLANMLDPDLFPYVHLNFSTFPAIDEALKDSTPSVSDSEYARKIIDFVRANVPNEWHGVRVSFEDTFFSLITPEMIGNTDPGLVELANLEVWGAPTSLPESDPA